MTGTDAEAWEQVRLADEPAFRLGRIEVIPALRQAVCDCVSQTLEPRVMQVLVVLAGAQGRIVGRGELTARCWDGRVVGDNALDRVISLLRHLAKDLGQGSFVIETVPKVGYRLKVPPGSAEVEGADAISSAPGGSVIDRRVWLGMLAATSLGAAGMGAFLWSAGAARRRARVLYEAGVDLQRQGRPDRVYQVSAYFRGATQADPNFAKAWGALALSYLDEPDLNYVALREAAFARARAAAERAVRLDPRDHDGGMAFVLVQPSFSRWASVESQARQALARMPGEWRLWEVVGDILGQTGRWGEAAAVARELAAREPYDLRHQRQLAAALWSTGEIEWARATLERAARLAPDNGSLWLDRFNFLALAGRPREALEFIQDVEARPGPLPLPFDLGILCARALASRDAGDVARAISGLIAGRRVGSVASFLSIPYLVVLGAVDTAYGQAADYYFGRHDPKTGLRRSLSPVEDRRTDFLFWRPMHALRADPRFGQLTSNIGLDNYWRTTGSAPDYRRSTPA